MNKPKKFKVVVDSHVYFINSKPELNKLLGTVTSSLGVLYGDSVNIKISIRGD